MLDPEEIDNYLINKVTRSGGLFFAEQDRLEAFRWYILAADQILDQHTDEFKDLFAQIFRQAGLEETDQLARQFEEQGEVFFTSSTYQFTLGQMGFCRIVDNFATYLKDLLSEVVHSQPEVLKSKEKERLDFILDFDTLEDLRSAIAEKKVEHLFFKGMDDIVSFFRDRLGIDLFSSEDALEKAVLLTKYRNLIVHNRGRVNKQFLRNHPDSYNEGDLLTFSFQDLSAHNLFFQGVVVHVDPLVAEKFNLNRYTRSELPGA